MQSIKITCDVCGKSSESREGYKFLGRPRLTLTFKPTIDCAEMVVGRIDESEISETISGIEDICTDCSKMITEYIRAAINTITYRKDVYQQERAVSKP